MAKTETVKARIEPQLKEQGEAVLSAIGLNTTEAITMFFRQLVMRQGLPFEAKIPNTETIAALEEDLTNAQRFSSVDEVMTDLHSDN
jgi:DNA-damage-inducible protein J